MKVYIAWACEPYGQDTMLGVYAKPEDAEGRIYQFNITQNKDRYLDTFVNEEEVQ